MKECISPHALLLGALILSGCASATPRSSGIEYYPELRPLGAIRSKDCSDAAVLLPLGAAAALDLTKKVFEAFDVELESAAQGQLQGQRRRHVGLLVGSGGEVLAAKLEEVSPGKTFVTATTTKTFVGIAGQSNWSCQIVEELIRLAGPAQP